MALRTQKAFAELLSVPQSQVSDWENDRFAVLDISSLIRLAKAFHCSVDELLAGVDPDYDRIREYYIAIVAEGDALPDGIAWEERQQARPAVLEWLPRPGDLVDPNAYGIRIRGDSMLPAFRPNMIAIVSPALAVRDGDEVYVQLTSGECLVRLLYTSRERLHPPAVQFGPPRAVGGAIRDRGDARNRVLAEHRPGTTTWVMSTSV